MAEHVIGEWKSFVFRMVEPSDFPIIEQHLKDNFYKDEPLSVHSVYDEEMGDDSNRLLLPKVKEDSRLCFVALDKSTGKLAGLRLIIWKKKSDKAEAPVIPKHPKILVVGMLLKKLSDEANIFERYPDVEQYADFMLVSVDRDYRGFGLATEIYDRSIKMLKALQMPLIKCIFTSPITQKIARKRGFKEISTIKLNEWTDDKGNPHWPNATDEECAILMIKELI